MWQADDERLRLDIGTELDLLLIPADSAESGWRLGVDFMTWTRLRSEGNFKFPVETIDYWFGLHACYMMEGGFGMRARIAHISSHLADGLADTVGTIAPQPFVYSREFIELLGGYSLGWFRPYAGITYVWSTKPDNPNPLIPEAGLDVRIPISGPWWLVGGYDFRLVGVDDVYVGANASQLGVKLETWNGTGLLLSLYGYSGRSMHGMFYTTTDAYLAVGFQVVW